MPFAQLVIGPPGSGKSTYCDGMEQFMTAIERKVSVVNLDPANDHTSYQPDLDVRDLVTIDEIMEQETLGPNGGILLEGTRRSADTYASALVVVHLTDSIVLSRPSLYVSSLLLALRSMLQMDLPHLNVLTKIDKLRDYGDLPFNLDFYTEVQDLNYLLPLLNREQTSGIPGPSSALKDEKGDTDMDDEEEPASKFSALNKAIVELVEDFALVGFETLAVEDKRSMMTLLRAIDRAGGYAFGGIEGANDTVWQMAMRSEGVTMDARDVQERWLDRRDELDEEERRAWAEESKEMKDPPQEAPPAASIPAPEEAVRRTTTAGGGDDDDDMEDDLEEMRKFIEGKKDGGVNVLKR
ncbi:hypothetical protein SLS60_008242 [Paraconiothyrium brasiliense]|uniref:GPN-loop GTPase 2 n=1 Tax=Paraconiothyrium brasiliense TaxID=300254 RepID=A0ABR3QZZ9_9PLEO